MFIFTASDIVGLVALGLVVLVFLGLLCLGGVLKVWAQFKKVFKR